MTVPSSVPLISDILKEKKQMFIALTETWLADHLDAELNINDYTLFRCDRERKKSRRGRLSGGVAVYMQQNIASHFKILSKYSNSVNELLILYFIHI